MTLAALAALVLAAPALAQYREYYIRGTVLDTQKQPIAGVQIRLLDVSTSRSFDVKSDKQGAFKLAGLPHGVYQVSFEKEGYQTRKDEWKFEQQQETMARVDVPDTILASQSQIQEAQRFEEAKSGVKEATEKLRKKDVDGAITILKGILANNPRDPSALYFLGLAYAEKRMCREAIDALTQVTELSPTPVAGVYFPLAVCHRQLGDLPKALEAYDKTLQLDPAHADSAYNSGLILFETNRVDEALVRFQQALTSRPSDPEVLEMIARCYLNQGKFEAAVDHLEKAKAASTDPAKIALLEELIRQVRAQVR
jgi:tetratricopeptide (TPR) repeat protein